VVDEHVVRQHTVGNVAVKDSERDERISAAVNVDLDLGAAAAGDRAQKALADKIEGVVAGIGHEHLRRQHDLVL
jgi:hypothetical protein